MKSHQRRRNTKLARHKQITSTCQVMPTPAYVANISRGPNQPSKPIRNLPNSTKPVAPFDSILPLELREMIWRLTFSASRIITLEEVSSRFNREWQATRSWEWHLERPHNDLPALQLCRESRAMALKLYIPLFGESATLSPIYFCPDRDILKLVIADDEMKGYIDWGHPRSYDMLKGNLSRVNTIILARQWLCNRTFGDTVSPCFRNVKVIMLEDHFKFLRRAGFPLDKFKMDLLSNGELRDRSVELKWLT